MSSLFIPDQTLRASESYARVVASSITGPNGTATRFVPFNENEVHYKAIRARVVLGESTLQLQEVDVIIQIEGEPLTLLKSFGTSIAISETHLERVRNLVKAEVVRLDEKARKAQGILPRMSEKS